MAEAPCAARLLNFNHQDVTSMTRHIAFLLGVHAHQPVGNFDFVLEEAYERCYGPFLRLMARYPDFPFALHVSGWLLDQWHRQHAEDMALLRTMVARGQVEMFTAGYAEPVLAAIPESDRVGQIARLSDDIQRQFGVRPTGSWLTERVWESSVVSSLHASGVRYVTVDDYHFLCAGKPQETLNGYYTTEEGGQRLDIFPIGEGLRYRIPFSPVHEVVGYLESLAREERLDAAVYFDDIEKFGVWPDTYEWVYEKGWLEQFLQAVLQSPIIQPMTYAQYHSQQSTRGPVYLPTTSYIEMNEWTLPADSARRFSQLVDKSRRDNHYDLDRPFIRGGIWRHFMMRYAEANHLHKRMLGLSQRFNALPAQDQTAERRDWLYLAQANDAYWHGLFGGLYLPHLRRALYQALLLLERDLDGQFPRQAVVIEDWDYDGYPETVIQNGVLQAHISGEGYAHLIELDYYPLTHNLVDTLTRKPEYYHDKILHREEESGASGGINPHERVSFKAGVSAQDLVFDGVRRGLFTDRDSLSRDPLRYYPAQVQGPDYSATFACSSPQYPSLTKKISLLTHALMVTYRQDRGASWEGFEVELNLAMPSCDGPAGRWEQGEQILGGLGQSLRLESFRQITLRDEVLGGQIILGCNIPCQLLAAPCHSISQSEAGFEKIMQAVTITLTPVDSKGQEHLIFSLTYQSF